MIVWRLPGGYDACINMVSPSGDSLPYFTIAGNGDTITLAQAAELVDKLKTITDALQTITKLGGPK